ncbi:hypothetical protein ARALYDRAFT_357318 [Arabidopsis lyrata subsp. lyrata]|uniref:Uncharacterized protein n=1 Tax=Arabidopsis lyrata subsp. lyrata TaxID=81972 RepID=D7MQ95_ARALL|nr:hypothetical protein ARALYDRAFT_357318 [Arabidopsis lyrata subsp. lyrata]
MASNQQPPSNLQTYGIPIYAVDWILSNLKSLRIRMMMMISPRRRHRTSFYPAEAGKDEACGCTDLPYRMTLHPRQDGLICALPNSCRLFDWDHITEVDNEEESEKVIKELKDVGQPLAEAR